MPNPNDDLQGYFRKRGIKTRPKTKEQLNFIGKNAKTTFDQMLTRQAARFTTGNTDVAALGEAYDNLAYKTTGGLEKTYEAVYGDSDYSASAENRTSLAVLDSAYGNTDASGTLNTSEVKTILGIDNKVVLNKGALRELNEILRRTQAGTSGIEDEETYGVRGEEEQDAPIEPIA